MRHRTVNMRSCYASVEDWARPEVPVVTVYSIRCVLINDLFFHIKSVKLNAYADDEQLYDSDIDPAELEKRLLRALNTANTWYNNNGMIVNPEKHQAMVLGTANYKFSFLVKNSMELFGVTIDTEMNFKEHIISLQFVTR